MTTMAHGDDGTPHDWLVQIGDADPVERRGLTLDEVVAGIAEAAAIAGASGSLQVRVRQLDVPVTIELVRVEATRPDASDSDIKEWE